MPNYSDTVKRNANEVIRYLYNNMPTYNQLKGTYTGIQMILNLMGLCASITELWSTRTPNALKNFEGDILYRADYLNAVRQRIEEWGKADVKNYFLTSRFDIDLQQNNAMSFKTFNNVSRTIIDTVLQMKPVTRCLRYLYYIIKIDTGIHFDYNIHFSEGSEDDGAGSGITVPLKNFRYKWDVLNNPLSYKSKIDIDNNSVYSLFLPWNTMRAAYIDPNSNETHTLKNAYFNLNELDRKFKLADQKTFRFKLEGNFKDKSYDSNEYEKIFTLNIGSEVDIKTETNGILIIFKGTAISTLIDLFNSLNEILAAEDPRYDYFLQSENNDELVDLIPENAVEIDASERTLDRNGMNLYLTAVFSVAMGYDYIIQNDNLSLDFDEEPQEDDTLICFHNFDFRVYSDYEPLKYIPTNE